MEQQPMTTQNSSDWLGLSGRVCVVTGGGGGIGRAVASSLARAGADVAAIDLDERGLEVTGAELSELGRDHVVTRCDTSSVESVTAASGAIEKSLGSCGVLVNTAAVLRPGGLENLSLAEWNAVLSINLTGYFLCAQIFGRHMRKLGGGSLVHVASMSRRSPAAMRRGRAAPTVSARPGSSCSRVSSRANGDRTASGATSSVPAWS
jgi:NAD(P)-dependent dehydrogenase (short-subunit alcohol dehydrogenase family)